MWYRKGKLRVKQIQVAWYDMERNGSCFDEDSIYLSENENDTLEEMSRIFTTYVETVEDENKIDRNRVFIHMDNGDMYELKMKKLSKEEIKKRINFYGN